MLLPDAWFAWGEVLSRVAGRDGTWAAVPIPFALRLPSRDRRRRVGRLDGSPLDRAGRRDAGVARTLVRRAVDAAGRHRAARERGSGAAVRRRSSRPVDARGRIDVERATMRREATASPRLIRARCWCVWMVKRAPSLAETLRRRTSWGDAVGACRVVEDVTVLSGGRWRRRVALGPRSAMAPPKNTEATEQERPGDPAHRPRRWHPAPAR